LVASFYFGMRRVKNEMKSCCCCVDVAAAALLLLQWSVGGVSFGQQKAADPAKYIHTHWQTHLKMESRRLVVVCSFVLGVSLGFSFSMFFGFILSFFLFVFRWTADCDCNRLH